MKPTLGWSSSFAFCAFAILALSLTPSSTPMPTTGWDKSNHILAFGTLAFLAYQAWPRRIWLLLPSLLAYGALIEVLQSLTPDRHAEWSDLCADGLGVLVGEVFARLKRYLAQRRAHR